LCSCVWCEAAIRATAEATPGMVLGPATECDRVAVTADYLAEVMSTDRTLATGAESASVRSVGDGGLASASARISALRYGWLMRPRGWRSAACHEDET
jgi:hypothetical protein